MLKKRKNSLKMELLSNLEAFFREISCLLTFIIVCQTGEVGGRTITRQCSSTINIMTEDGAYIEPVPKSSVQIKRLHKGFEDGHMLAFEVNATSANGVLFYLMSKHRKPEHSEYVALEIVNRYFRYHIKCSHLDAMLTVPKIIANNGKYHKIVFQRRRSRGKLLIDGVRYFHNFRVGCKGFRSLTFGGISAEDRRHINSVQGYRGHFEGCIRKVDTSTSVSRKPQYYAVSQCT